MRRNVDLRLAVVSVVVVWAVVLFFAANVSAESPPDYEVLEIRAATGQSFWVAYDLNNFGMVVGVAFAETDEGICTRPYVWTEEGGMVDLGVNPGRCGVATIGLNDLGQIVGFVDPDEPPGVGPQMFVLEPDSSLWFPAPFDEGDTTPEDINNVGQVIFLYRPPPPVDRWIWYPFLLDGETVVDLSLPGATEGRVSGLNDSGAVVGILDGLECSRSGFIWEDSVHTLLGDCDNPVRPEGINASGQVVGFTENPTGGPPTAILLDGGVLHDLGALGGERSFAWGLNDHGWIVGEATTAPNATVPFGTHAFIYVDGVMYDLNELLPVDTPWELIEAAAINNNGQVLAFGFRHDPDGDVSGWVLLDPVLPETAEELLEELIDDVEDLVDDDQLNHGQGRSLIAQLEVALWFLEFHDGERIAAIQLKVFIKKVELLIESGDLDPALGSELLVKANAALELLQSE